MEFFIEDGCVDDSAFCGVAMAAIGSASRMDRKINDRGVAEEDIGTPEATDLQRNYVNAVSDGKLRRSGYNAKKKWPEINSDHFFFDWSSITGVRDLLPAALPHCYVFRGKSDGWRCSAAG